MAWHAVLLALIAPLAIAAEAAWPRPGATLVAIFPPGTDPLAGLARLDPGWRLVDAAPGRLWLRAAETVAVDGLRQRLGALAVFRAPPGPGCPG